MAKLAVGIDIGGTKVLVILADSRGKIYRRDLIPTQKPDITLRRALNVIQGYRLKLKRPIAGLGIACAGAVDAKGGSLISSPNLPRWKNAPFRNYFARRLKVPVVIENDANAAAWGERCFGAGKGAENLLYYTVSTGIGGGIIIEGKIYHGKTFNAGEIGHSVMLPSGPKCGCGKRGCLEQLASGSAIAKLAKREVKHNPGSLLRKLKGKVGAEQVFAAAKKGDKLSRQVLRYALYYLGINIANMIQILDPEIVIIGGGVSNEGAEFFTPLKKIVRRFVWEKLYRACPIVKAKLRDDAGALGMVALTCGPRGCRRGGRRVR
jgi:glucokinase